MIDSVALCPPFALQVEAGPFVLAAVTDADLGPLVELIDTGLHDAGSMPFSTPWTAVAPEQRARNTAAYYWRSRAEFTPASWRLDLVVRREGVLVGVQGVSTADYLITRTGETGSWLGQRYQRRGYGTAMRQLMCALLFDHLDAAEITSGAFLDNPASLAVSRKVGYRPDGTDRRQRRAGELALHRRLVLTPAALVRAEWPLTVTGIDPLRRFIGLATPAGVPGHNR